MSLGDYDEDGFVDLSLGSCNRGLTALYHNNGNSNHWRRVELVGTQSNRSAIGVQVFATSGNLQQMPEDRWRRGCTSIDLLPGIMRRRGS